MHGLNSGRRLPAMLRRVVCGLLLAGAALTMKGEITPPKLQQPLSAMLPRSIKHLTIANPEVEILARVGRSGRVEDYVAVEASHADLLARAEDVLSDGRFQPATRDGEPFVSDVRVVISFAERANHRDLLVDQSLVEHLDSREYARNPDRFRYRLVTNKDLDQPLNVIRRGLTVVPATEEGERLAGRAVVEVYVDREGKPRLPRIIESTGDEVSQAAYASIVDWQFSRPTHRGKPAVIKVRIPFEYSLEGQSAS